MAYILLGLIIIYMLKGMVYPTGTISMCIAALELGICLLFGLKSLKFIYKSRIVYILYFLTILVTMSFFLSSKIRMSQFGSISTFTFYREFCGAVFPFFGMYFLVRKNKINKKLLTWSFYLIFLSAVAAFFFETVRGMIESNKEFLTSNGAYRFLYLMPFVVFIKNRYIITLLWIISFIIAIISAKRGTIVGLTFEFIVYYWWRFRESKNKWWFIIIALLLISISIHYLIQYYMDNQYFQMRVEATLEGKTSGRDYIIFKLLNYYTKANIFQQIFGCGFAITLSAAGNYAHNDWIEMLLDCGIIGVVLYGLFYLSLIRCIISSTDKIKKILLLIIIAFFPTSFYSMVFFSESSSIGFLWLGLAIGMVDKKKSSNKYRHCFSNLYNIDTKLS